MKKETILTSLTANTHMRERAAPAEASGQSRGTMFFSHVFLYFVYPRHLPTPTTDDLYPLPTTFSYAGFAFDTSPKNIAPCSNV